MPVFSAKKDGREIKGILAAKVIKVNYTAENWEQEKRELEQWLTEAGFVDIRAFGGQTFAPPTHADARIHFLAIKQ